MVPGDFLSQLKLLFLPIEYYLGQQAGTRNVFETMYKEKTLGGLEIFSYLYEAKNLGSPGKMWAKAAKLAETFQPDILFIQHIGNLPITIKDIHNLRSIKSNPTLVYEERDVFGWVIKGITKSMKVIASQSDIVFLVGLGRYGNRYLKFGAQEIQYTSHAIDTIHFNKEWTPTPKRDFDLIMIGNRIIPRFRFLNPIKWGRMSGAYEREQLVKKMGKVFGNRFAIFGTGWEGFIGNQGPIPYAEQEKIMRKAWLTVCWDHFPHIPFYHSDRLPISLGSGVAHLTNYHPGYEVLFKNGETLAWANSVDEMVDTARVLLNQGPERLTTLGLQGREYALAHLTDQIVFRSILERTAAYRFRNR